MRLHFEIQKPMIKISTFFIFYNKRRKKEKEKEIETVRVKKINFKQRGKKNERAILEIMLYLHRLHRLDKKELKNRIVSRGILFKVEFENMRKLMLTNLKNSNFIA